MWRGRPRPRRDVCLEVCPNICSGDSNFYCAHSVIVLSKDAVREVNGIAVEEPALSEVEGIRCDLIPAQAYVEVSATEFSGIVRMPFRVYLTS